MIDWKFGSPELRPNFPTKNCQKFSLAGFWQCTSSVYHLENGPVINWFFVIFNSEWTGRPAHPQASPSEENLQTKKGWNITCKSVYTKGEIQIQVG